MRPLALISFFFATVAVAQPLTPKESDILANAIAGSPLWKLEAFGDLANKVCGQASNGTQTGFHPVPCTALPVTGHNMRFATNGDYELSLYYDTKCEDEAKSSQSKDGCIGGAVNLHDRRWISYKVHNKKK